LDRYQLKMNGLNILKDYFSVERGFTPAADF